MIQLEVWEEAFVYDIDLVKKTTTKNQNFFSLSFFPCFSLDNTLTCNAEWRIEIKWGLRFWFIQAILNTHQIVSKQFRSVLFNYAAE